MPHSKTSNPGQIPEMNMSTPTRTTNRLHFEDLDWRRFENLSYELLHRECEWKELNPIGQMGNDGGVDIIGIDNKGGTWYVQCKNHKAFSKADSKAIIDEIIENYTIGNRSVFLAILACNISNDTLQFIKSYSENHGFESSFVWTGMKLEAMLYDKHKDLLSKYFDFTTGNRNKEKVLQANKMKQVVQKKLLRDFEWNHNTRMQLAKDPSLQFKYAKADIRSINDIDDPYGDDASFCRIFPFQLTEVGIEFLFCPWINYRIAINTTTRCWRKLEGKEKFKENEFDVRADYIVLIPYYCIVDIMEEGDERSEYPIIICDFEFNNTPFLRSYYKDRMTKADFMEGKPVDIPFFTLLLEEFQKNYKTRETFDEEYCYGDSSDLFEIID